MWLCYLMLHILIDELLKVLNVIVCENIFRNSDLELVIEFNLS